MQYVPFIALGAALFFLAVLVFVWYWLITKKQEAFEKSKMVLVVGTDKKFPVANLMGGYRFIPGISFSSNSFTPNIRIDEDYFKYRVVLIPWKWRYTSVECVSVTPIPKWALGWNSSSMSEATHYATITFRKVPLTLMVNFYNEENMLNFLRLMRSKSVQLSQSAEELASSVAPSHE